MNFLSEFFKRHWQSKDRSLRQGEDMFRTFVKESSEGFAIADEQGVIIEWNHALEALSGISRVEAIGKFFWDTQFRVTIPELRTPHNLELLRSSMQAFLKNGKADYMGRLNEGELLRPDGQRRAIVQAVYPIKTARGYRLASIIHDVTEQRQMEQQVKAAQANLIALVENSQDAIWSVDRDLLLVSYNAPFARLVLQAYGRTAEAGKPIDQYFPSEQRGVVQQVYKQVLAGARLVREDTGIIQEMRHYFELTFSPIFADHAVVGAVGSCRDITERKQMELALRSSEEKYRTLTENINVGVFRTSIEGEGRLVHCNSALAKILGYDSVAEMIGGKVTEAYKNPEDRKEILNALFTRGGFHDKEVLCRKKNGQSIWCSASATLMHDAQGRPVWIDGIIEDITERKRTENALRESEERFRKMAENIHDGLIIVEDKKVIYVNDRHCEITGYSREELFRINPLDIAAPEDREKIHGIYEDFMRTGTLPLEAEYRIKRKDGTTCYISNRYSVNRQGSGIYGWYIVTTDISERKRAEEALRKSQERLELALQGADLGTWEWYVNTGIFLFSDRTINMLGYTRDEIDPQRNIIKELIHPEDSHRINDRLQAHLEGSTPAYEAEYRLRTKNGQWKWILDRGKVVDRDGEGRPVRMAGTHLDITDRKRAEDMLRLTQYSIDHSMEAAYWIRPDGTLFYVNEAACRSLGYSSDELLQMSIADIDPEWPAAEWQTRYEHLKHSNGASFESMHRRKDGTDFPVQITANYSSFEGQEFIFAFAVDITRQKMMQQEALRAAHFASIGELAAGVAHEINNPITGIINYAGLICDGIETMDESVEIARRIMKEGERIGSIVSNLLSFARDENREPEPSSVEEIFSDAQALFQKKLGQNNIIVEKNFPPGLPRVLVNPPKIEQVFVNCLSNALDALNAKYPGADQNKRIEVHAAALTLAAKPYVRVILHDHGIGIPEAIIDKICNPFFTLKQTGRGTGLGLSISYNIIKDYNGHLLFESREGEYTKVIIDLPAIE